MAIASARQDVIDRIDGLPHDHLNEFGVDPFGFDPEVLKSIMPMASWLYENYFRCEAHGLENMPCGRVIVVANHSGQLPFDGLMIGSAFLLKAEKPRFLRGMAEKWSATLPFISKLFSLTGQCVGLPANCRKLLEMDEAVFVFPEGVKGISKLYSQKYQLQDFGLGFMRLAMETQSPILPVVLIGAEEQAAAIANITPLAKIFGLPALPLIFPQIIPVPLPVKYHIHVGKPLNFNGNSNDDDLVTRNVKKVRRHMEIMIEKGRKQRQSIFFN